MANARFQIKETNRDKSKEVAEILSAEAHIELMIDITLEDSFPASDPPSWTLGREVNRIQDLNQKRSNL